MLRQGPCTLQKLRFARQVRCFRPDTRWPDWEVVVGIEVHAQIKSRRKLFSNSPTPGVGASPNAHVSVYDASFPGTLPQINPKCVDLAVRTAIALDSQVQLRSAFDRKHYFYSDLPVGYQITQHYAPIALGGVLRLPEQDAVVRVKQIQLEQDTAKSILDPRRSVSEIDLNRAGCGLLEIVSEPDMRSPEDAREYVKALQAVLRFIGSSDGNMEQGSFRCDVNVSVNRPNKPPGTRCEVKNLNSVKFMMIAITAEIYRQTDLLNNNLPVLQETRGFDEHKAQTFKLRSKEDAPDYRYMPDPNLPPLLLTPDYVSRIRDTMPSLPHATRAKLSSLGLSTRDVDVLMSVDSGSQVPYDGEMSRDGALVYFNKVAAGRDPKIVANWITHGLLGQLSACNQTFADNPVTAEQMGELIDMIQGGNITGTSGKYILRHMVKTRSEDMPSKLAEESLGLGRHSTSSQLSSQNLRTLCEEVVRAFPEESAKVKRLAGDAPVMNRLIGAVMKRSKGRADAVAARKILVSIIGDADVS